ncbi:MAG: hypothetical protein ABH950_07405 [Candidatus Altiarchaeota archaeon]
MFRQFAKLEKSHQTIFALIIGVSVVMFWRGIWGLLDLLLFPGNPHLSYFISFAAGVIILTACDYLVRELT